MPMSLAQSQTSTSDSLQKTLLQQQQLAQLRAWQEGLLEQVTVEFFPPTPSLTPSETVDGEEEGVAKRKAPRNANTNPPNTNPPNTNSPNTNSPNTKRITTTRLLTHSAQTEQHTQAETTTLQSQVHHTESRNTDSAPAPDPYRWRYLFYGLLVVASLFLARKLRLL